MAAPELRTLDQILSLANAGSYLPDLQQRIADLLQSTRDFADSYRTKATAQVKINLSVTINGFGEAEIVVTDEIKTPKPPKAKALGWLTDDGALTTAHPGQAAMEIRDVGGRREFTATPANR